MSIKQEILELDIDTSKLPVTPSYKSYAHVLYHMVEDDVSIAVSTKNGRVAGRHMLTHNQTRMCHVSRFHFRTLRDNQLIALVSSNRHGDGMVTEFWRHTGSDDISWVLKNGRVKRGSKKSN